MYRHWPQFYLVKNVWGNEGVKTGRFATANVLQTSQNPVWPRQDGNIYFHRKLKTCKKHVLLPKLSNVGGSLLISLLFVSNTWFVVSVVNLNDSLWNSQGKVKNTVFLSIPLTSPLCLRLIPFLSQIHYYYWVCFQIHCVNEKADNRASTDMLSPQVALLFLQEGILPNSLPF